MTKRLLLVLLLCLTIALPVVAAPARDISSVEAKTIIAKTKKLYILDVRTPQERLQGYIAGSTLIPIDVIGSRLAEVPKNRPILVYCAVGSRSRAVAQGLSRLGYPEVYNMYDGIVGWQRQGYPVKR